MVWCGLLAASLGEPAAQPLLTLLGGQKRGSTNSGGESVIDVASEYASRQYDDATDFDSR